MNKTTEKINIKQVGVMGSAADLKYSKKIENIAFELGKLLAQNGYIVLYGAEKDYDSLSTAAARGSKSVGGTTVGVTYGKTPDIWGEMRRYTDVVVCAGMERGGGREYILVSSCDAIVTVGGGSGTLNEMTIAYQKKIPIVSMKGSGGRSDKLANQYIDERYKEDPQRRICKGADTPEEAINYLNSLK